MNVHRTASLTETQHLVPGELRERFVLENLFVAGEMNLVYTDLDRAIIGGICPGPTPLKLNASDALRADYFFERREAGVLNVGQSPAVVSVDGAEHALGANECLYIGRGSREVSFSAPNASPADLFFCSLPAHTGYPTTKAGIGDAQIVHVGSGDSANERVIHQYIHERGIQSCQLVMGFTVIQPGSVWNTMPPHTHERRSEVYLYYDVPADHAIIHLMGRPDQSRHLVLRDKEVVLSPSWSMHAGCGTSNYKFVWAMGGENQCFDDMDPVPIGAIR